MISIIIPTKNEEKYLPLLLNSIEAQGIDDLEIIIADANSTDRTREIAKYHGCKIVEGGLPAKGRNNGASHSNGDLLIFVDSDIILPPGFLKKSLKEFNDRKLDVAGTLQKPISTNGKFDFSYKAIYSFTNKFMLLAENLKPYMQVCMFCKREIHKKIGGFDERMVYAEDSNYAERAGKVGKFGILRSGYVLISPRRFENNLSFVLKCIFFNIARLGGYEFYEDRTKFKYFN